MSNIRGVLSLHKLQQDLEKEQTRFKNKQMKILYNTSYSNTKKIHITIANWYQQIIIK